MIADFQKGHAMKTLFIAVRAAIFGTGFIFLWGWVALSLHHRYDITLGIVLSDYVLVELGHDLARSKLVQPDLFFVQNLWEINSH